MAFWMRKSGGRSCLFGILFAAALSASAQSQSSVTLAWDLGADNSISGYEIHYGAASHNYTDAVSVGLVSRVTISGLNVGTTYYFAATAYNLLGLESDYSEEVSYTVPPVETIEPSLQLTITPTGQVILTGTGTPGQACNILMSQDFMTWTVIGMITFDATGAFQLIDPAGTSQPGAFYKLEIISRPTVQLEVTDAGEVNMIGNGTPDQICDILMSEDGESWTVIGTQTMDANGSFQFTDPAGNTRAISLYKLQVK